ncbi:hypothetical protein ONZ51_g6339 [Trametes cubensis]|uniref:Uncharacterized protein n=1 Tax=Trametes cubensis TaxID=1111947 RepID=A0AAD7TS81_9APHY|nr:hypothetical protein ONZ51_g6339 [Trametes cubensis]
MIKFSPGVHFTNLHGTSFAEEAIAALENPTLSPEEVANTITSLCREVVKATPPSEEANGGDDTPGLEGFLWDIWNAVVTIAEEDTSSHDRLAAILPAIKAKGKSGCEGWRIWGNDFDWANLPVYGPAVRESMNGPSPATENQWIDYHDSSQSECRAALAGDPPTDSPASRAGAAARKRWLNLNAFLARLWALGVMDCTMYGISTMRMELEPYSLPPEKRPPTEAYGIQEIEVENAAIWVRIAGKRMFECREILGPKGNPNWDPQYGAAGSSGGTWEGVDGYHPERWALWKSIFGKIANEGGRQNMVDAAKVAVVAMEQIEREAAPRSTDNEAIQ